MRTGTSSLIAALLLSLVGTATARATPREREGFFLRLGLGGGGMTMKREGNLSAGGGNYRSYLGSSTIEGGGGAFDLSLGGTVAPGWVIGATLSTLSHDHGELKKDGGGSERLPGPLNFASLGLSIDWFPAPHGGFHLTAGAALAGAWVKSPPPAFTEYLGGAGGAMNVGAGYLWWISDGWSLGLLARFTGAKLHGEDTQLGITGSEDDTVSAATLLIQGVYH